MFDRLGRLVVSQPKMVIAAALVLLIAAMAYGGHVADRLAGGGFWSASSESKHAAALLSQRFHAGKPNVVILATNSRGQSVDEPDAVTAGRSITRQLADAPGVDAVVSYWGPGTSELLRSRDGTRALVLAHVGGDELALDKVAKHLTETFRDTHRGPLDLQMGGEAIAYIDVTQQLTKDLFASEAVAMPVIGLLLLLVFGSLVAAGLPLIIGVFSIVGTLGLLTLLTNFTPVSSYALNLTTILGLGLAIDYSLFIVTRFREERAGGHDTESAVVTSVRTAGRTVVFSALTVTLSMLAMLTFPMMYLRSIAYTCIGVVMLAALCAVVVLPALLKLLGARVDSLDLRRPIRHLIGRPTHPRTPAVENGFWFRTARLVMRRPVLLGGAVLIFVLLLGTPFFGIHIGFSDDRAMPTSVESRRVGDTIRNEFPAQPTAAMDVIVDAPVARDRLYEYATALSQLPHVVTVTTPSASYAKSQRIAGTTTFHAEGVHLTVLPDVDPYSEEADRLLEQVRHPPAPGPVLVGGLTAENIDTKDALVARIPLAAGVIVVAMFTLLFAFTGSVVLPLKALILNVISLSATLGAMVFIFQEGHLKWLVGEFTAIGTLAAPTPVLMFCMAFGLSMDYEVFLLSRIVEEYRAHGDTNAAVMYGLQRVGPIVTAAALIMSIVCIAMATSQVSFMKMTGVGLTLAILVDATLIRAVLMPAAMRLLGSANWWAPAPFRALRSRTASLHETNVPAKIPSDV
ncbi:MAG TPA: MMPL family transporter [Mycobacterium sp.]|uniref:MMPL family transporter n=1 Tax=Mycobacterium sp. TaxID=1785 RepID=UPI002CA01264|nr:MMPL family transporter [Mycobacterium sp.]HME74165.1 MMPL family transporter [Mycobacterium sp.]